MPIGKMFGLGRAVGTAWAIRNDHVVPICSYRVKLWARGFLLGGIAMFYRIVASIGILGTLAACTGIPKLDVAGPVAVSKIVEEVQCEVLAAVRDHPRLRTENWAVSVNLTLQVDDSVGLTPTVAYVDPSASFSFGAAGTLKGARQRIYVETLDLEIASMKPRPSCKQQPDTFDLSGNLGIEEAVNLGLGSIKEGDPARFDKDKAFGQTIQFVLTKNVSGVGPMWTLTHFTGPGGFFGAERIDTNELVISFAPGVIVKKPAVGAALRGQPSFVAVPGGGALRARDLTDQLILRSLPAFRPVR
ncbi:hypothetical protein CK489_14255 [Bradyrhizobium sp. UFLA03-84]|uniref:hypothetical protein n=1 Tax=Bradyrhizobium sp. UFLA03-84 TaxID=418599 RepID=UPI000BAE65FF|nr:hypothetical protein [Bradyrhizobium sp. UFLA03-84]PAY06984.1 hypothetical protein CK489_14255 [Bradyrhizobium sp. UFLA03-84]